MSVANAEMTAYINGDFVLAQDATVSIFDRGLMHGDGAFDNVRTFGGRPFKVDAHLDRLERSLKYLEIGNDALIKELETASMEIIDRNFDKIIACGDTYVIFIVTRGLMPETGFLASGTPTRIVMVKKLDFPGFGPLYTSGVELASSLLTSHFAGAIDPRVKTTSKGSAIRAELKASRHRRETGRAAWMIMFNADGSIGESHASNVCIVAGGEIVRPPRHQALEGVSVDVLCDLAVKLGLEVRERPIHIYDLLDADEVLVTGTSYCALPVATLDGIPLNKSREVYEALIESWIDLVEFDFVAQAQERCGDRARTEDHVASEAVSGVSGQTAT